MEVEGSPESKYELQGFGTEPQYHKDQFSLLSDLARWLSSDLDPRTVLQRTLDAACELVKVRYGALAVFDTSGQIRQFFTYGINPEEQALIGDDPQGLGILRWAYVQGKPLRLSAISEHPQSVGFPPNHPSLTTLLSVPVRHGDEVLANLYLAERLHGEEFTFEDETLLVQFADGAATAIRNAQLHVEWHHDTARLKALVDTYPIGILVAEAHTGRVVLANRELERMTGIDSSQELQLDHYDRIGTYRRPDGRLLKPEEIPIHRALRGGEIVHAEEVWLEFPNGRRIATLVSATPAYSADGEIMAGVAVIQDIAPLQQVEKLRSEFLGLVSHELKTPLAAIKGAAAMALSGYRPLDAAEAQELFHVIDEQTDRLRDLVDKLLDMSLIEAGSLSINPEPVDLLLLLEEARATFSHSGGCHEVKLKLNNSLPAVNADGSRIIQVVLNLLSNAAKSSSATEPIIVEVEHKDKQVAVHIRDRGRGIPQEKMPHLFKKFSRIHDKERRLSGTGLGLAIGKGIVEAHGGRIWVESAGEGKGCIFSFTLPVAENGVTSSLRTARKAEHLGKVCRVSERTRVLAVDDEPQILRYVSRLLDEAGYRAIVTSDPSQMAKLIELEQPDLVLLDLVLPTVSGFELLRLIREFSGVPVVFLTVSNRSEDAVRALTMGADDYIIKPFSGSELIARIEAVLRRRVLADQVEVRPCFMLNDLTINFVERSITLGGKSISISPTEYKVLYELATHAGRVLTHEQILHRVWGREYSGETELVRSVIRNLRRKLDDDARRARYILNEAGVGYRMPEPRIS